MIRILVTTGRRGAASMACVLLAGGLAAAAPRAQNPSRPATERVRVAIDSAVIWTSPFVPVEIGRAHV